VIRFLDEEPGPPPAEAPPPDLPPAEEAPLVLESTPVQRPGAGGGAPGARLSADDLARLERAALQGDVQAMYHLGAAHFHRRVSRPSGAEAERWLRAAADRGHPLAFYGLGLMLQRGLRGVRDPQQAHPLLLRGAEAGDTRCMILVGANYQGGEGVPRDEPQAVRWYRKAVDAGDPRAFFPYGFMLATGRGVPEDLDEAARWFRRAQRESPEPMDREMAEKALAKIGR
jgi:TPR repeat protein